MGFTVIGTDDFEKQVLCCNLPLSRIYAVSCELERNPFVGRVLGKCLREKRYKDKRIYFYVFKEHNIVFMVAASNKESQQKNINYLKLLYCTYLEIARKFSENLFDKQ